MDSSSKLRIRIGDVEMDYEGSEAFLKEELPELLRTAMQLHKAAAVDDSTPPKRTNGNGGGRTVVVPRLTTGSIAAKTKAKSGPALLLAAAAHLTLVAQKETFSRQELLAAMQSASGYYKQSFSKNLSKYINGALTDEKLSETAKNVYSLQATARAGLEKELADN